MLQKDTVTIVGDIDCPPTSIKIFQLIDLCQPIFWTSAKNNDLNKGENNRFLLLDTAERLFRQNGVRAMSLRDVMKAADVN